MKKVTLLADCRGPADKKMVGGLDYDLPTAFAERLIATGQARPIEVVKTPARPRGKKPMAKGQK